MNMPGFTAESATYNRAAFSHANPPERNRTSAGTVTIGMPGTTTAASAPLVKKSVRIPTASGATFACPWAASAL
jgi:hypothetical protein